MSKLMRTESLPASPALRDLKVHHHCLGFSTCQKVGFGVHFFKYLVPLSDHFFFHSESMGL